MQGLETRIAAIDILVKYQNEKAYLSDLLRKYAALNSVHYSLLQKLVKGSAQRLPAIEVALTKELGDLYSKASIKAKTALLIAAYQLIYLDQISIELITSETLALIKGTNLVPLQKKIPAAVRSLRKLHGIKPNVSADLSNSSAAQLATEYHHPLWLVERWITEIGIKETSELCRANNEEWPVSVRVNTLHNSSQAVRRELVQLGVKLESSNFLADCFKLVRFPRGLRLHQLPPFRHGQIQVQDESAALVTELLNPRPGEFVVDLCAAPGGKAIHIAEKMKNRGSLLAIDVNEERLRMVEQNIRRHKLNIVKLKQADARRFKLERSADRILLDAPCSGLGAIGRKVEIRWTKNQAQLKDLCELQRQLLTSAAQLLKPGGFLVYSTCTVLKEENENQIAWFLNRFPEFQIAKTPKHFPAEVLTSEGFMRTWPHRHGMGGAFAALLRKRSNST